MNTILLIDDDEFIYELVKIALKDSTIVYCKNLAEAEAVILTKEFSFIILDLNLPDGEGLRFLSKIKQNELLQSVPIAILSAELGISHKVMAFEYGIDDYIVKPFDPVELKSRIYSKIKKNREGVNEGNQLVVGDLAIDLRTYKAMLRSKTGDTDLGLTPIEIKILFLMAKKLEQVFSREHIMDFLWKDTFVSDRTVDSHIAHIRQKIAGSGVTIETVKGIGYKVVKK